MKSVWCRYEEELVHCAKVEEAKLAMAARERDENRPPPRNPLVTLSLMCGVLERGVVGFQELRR